MIGSLFYSIGSMVHFSVSIGSISLVNVFLLVPNQEGRKEGGWRKQRCKEGGNVLSSLQGAGF